MCSQATSDVFTGMLWRTSIAFLPQSVIFVFVVSNL